MGLHRKGSKDGKQKISVAVLMRTVADSIHSCDWREAQSSPLAAVDSILHDDDCSIETIGRIHASSKKNSIFKKYAYIDDEAGSPINRRSPKYSSPVHSPRAPSSTDFSDLLFYMDDLSQAHSEK